jgi:hypothetical protein
MFCDRSPVGVAVERGYKSDRECRRGQKVIRASPTLGENVPKVLASADYDARAS